MWKFAPQIYLDMLRVIGFEVAIMRLVKMDEKRHHLAVTQLACSLTLFAGGKLGTVPLGPQLEHEIIDITKHFEETYPELTLNNLRLLRLGELYQGEEAAQEDAG